MVSDVNPMFVIDFEYYLKTTRSCCSNTSVRYIKNLKKIVLMASANGRLKNDPFANIRFRPDDVDLAYLDEAELNTLFNKKFDIERMQKVQDVYLFC